MTTEDRATRGKAPEERARRGIVDGPVRVSRDLEDAEDPIADLARAPNGVEQ